MALGQRHLWLSHEFAVDVHALKACWIADRWGASIAGSMAAALALSMWLLLYAHARAQR